VWRENAVKQADPFLVVEAKKFCDFVSKANRETMT
jgi:hypothetical protein